MQSPSPDRSPDDNRRKEKRFETVENGQLHCRTSIDDPGFDQVWEGTTIDISPSGIRLLTKGNFKQGQPIWTELLTTKSYGIYRGNIRRVEPWVDGQLILGCSLRDTIPREVLENLAAEGIINRRRDGRFKISHKARISWPLAPAELDVELQDFSLGGMKLWSSEPIPADARLRLRFEAAGQEVVIESKLAWTRRSIHGWISGIAFTDRCGPQVVAETLGQTRQAADDKRNGLNTSKIGSLFALFAVLVLFGYMVFASP